MLPLSNFDYDEMIKPHRRVQCDPAGRRIVQPRARLRPRISSWHLIICLSCHLAILSSYYLIIWISCHLIILLPSWSSPVPQLCRSPAEFAPLWRQPDPRRGVELGSTTGSIQWSNMNRRWMRWPTCSTSLMTSRSSSRDAIPSDPRQSPGQNLTDTWCNMPVRQQLVIITKMKIIPIKPKWRRHLNLVVEARQEILWMVISQAATSSPHYYQWRVHLAQLDDDTLNADDDDYHEYD